MPPQIWLHGAVRHVVTDTWDDPALALEQFLAGEGEVGGPWIRVGLTGAMLVARSAVVAVEAIDQAV